MDIGHKAITELAESPAQLSYFWWALSCSGYQVKNGVHIEELEAAKTQLEDKVKELHKVTNGVHIEPEFLRVVNKSAVREMETMDMQ